MTSVGSLPETSPRGVRKIPRGRGKSGILSRSIERLPESSTCRANKPTYRYCFRPEPRTLFRDDRKKRDEKFICSAALHAQNGEEGRTILLHSPRFRIVSRREEETRRQGKSLWDSDRPCRPPRRREMFIGLASEESAIAFSHRDNNGQLQRGPVELFNCARLRGDVHAPRYCLEGIASGVKEAGDEYSNWPAASCFGLLRSVNLIALVGLVTTTKASGVRSRCHQPHWMSLGSDFETKRNRNRFLSHSLPTPHTHLKPKFLPQHPSQLPLPLSTPPL
ncbi:hypothetical protein WN51_14481 [Melipona quadrifasciata]|uniref:Uncharacterized protein n=1 Tax=Melipona quadrifasciata TaxID=166423 RepID=A0A0M8ZY19_9HYME|nr:hypothetical protein WN51_14481 [Melipona quadrifasciata]